MPVFEKKTYYYHKMLHPTLPFCYKAFGWPFVFANVSLSSLNNNLKILFFNKSPITDDIKVKFAL